MIKYSYLYTEQLLVTQCLTLYFRDLDSRCSKIGTASLQISNIVEKDAGNYQCRAENKEDAIEATATLHVQGEYLII